MWHVRELPSCQLTSPSLSAIQLGVLPGDLYPSVQLSPSSIPPPTQQELGPAAQRAVFPGLLSRHCSESSRLGEGREQVERGSSHGQLGCAFSNSFSKCCTVPPISSGCTVLALPCSLLEVKHSAFLELQPQGLGPSHLRAVYMLFLSQACFSSFIWLVLTHLQT